jgi:hypothetical protein
MLHHWVIGTDHIKATQQSRLETPDSWVPKIKTKSKFVLAVSPRRVNNPRRYSGLIALPFNVMALCPFKTSAANTH